MGFRLKIGCFSSIFIAAFGLLLSLSAMEPSVNVQESANGLPNLSARRGPNAREFDVFANLIVWTAKEAGADCWAEVIHSDGTTFSNDLLQVDFGWDPGFRIGARYGSMHDQWDTRGLYTWFHTKGKDSVSSGPGTVHSAFLGSFYVNNPNGLNLSGPSYEKASIAWTIHFNMFDWELGRNYWVSESLSLRPFLGAKGGWIDQSIHTKWEHPDLTGALVFNAATENLTNDFWGIGPAAGINTQWILFSSESRFYLFGDFSGAIMWGHWSFGDVYQNDIHQQISIDLQNLNSGASMLRTFMGFGWDANFGQNQYRFSTRLGYEMQFWLDQLQFYSFTGGRLVNELTLQGGTFEVCFEF